MSREPIFDSKEQEDKYNEVCQLLQEIHDIMFITLQQEPHIATYSAGDIISECIIAIHKLKYATPEELEELARDYNIKIDPSLDSKLNTIRNKSSITTKEGNDYLEKQDVKTVISESTTKKILH